MKKLFFLLLLLAVLVACNDKKTKLTPEALQAYQQEVDAWHANRIEKVKAPNGWINLVGLHWLKPGINSFGSAKSNNLVFPEGKIAAEAGYFLVTGNKVEIFVNKNVAINTQGRQVDNQVIFQPDSPAVVLQSGSLRWNIIKRDAELGVRLRDDESKAIASFRGVSRFPIDPSYRVDAIFEKADSIRTINIVNVLGQTTAQRSPGTLVFVFDGDEYRLDVLEGGKDEYFIIIGDATSGKETYAGGRFIYVKHEDADGKVVLDFNKAYNPPCVFTPYATCPLPPAQNVLPIEIKAGELDYTHGK